MDWWNLFWTAFGAIGGTIGAVATAAAVIVALWQTKYANSKKLKIEFSDNIIIVPSEGDFSGRQEYVGITVTNIGNRRVKVCDWRIVLPGNRQAVILRDISPMSKLLCPSWPLFLEPEEQSSQYWKKEQFYALVQDEAAKCAEKGFCLSFLVTDSTGKKYSIKCKKSMMEYQSEAEAYLNAHT